jgi:hypothetical protein
MKSDVKNMQNYKLINTLVTANSVMISPDYVCYKIDYKFATRGSALTV